MPRQSPVIRRRRRVDDIGLDQQARGSEHQAVDDQDAAAIHANTHSP